MRPRDIAKIGYLYLNKGLWDDKQLISSGWIEESTRKHVTANLFLDYGYQWWITDSGDFLALGYGGQYIFVVPDKNMVVVFTSHLSQKDSTIPFAFLHSNIIPAVKSRKPLPESPQKQEALESIIALWQTTRPEDREKIREKTGKTSLSLLPGEYLNNEYGFSVKYDPQLIIVDSKLDPPMVFSREGTKGIPIFGVAVDDIPQGMKLENTGELIIDFYKKIPQVKDLEIYKQEIITLSDGTKANYVEINYKYRSYKMQTVSVHVYKDKKVISVGAVGARSTPKDYLSDMAKSLRFKN